MGTRIESLTVCASAPDFTSTPSAANFTSDQRIDCESVTVYSKSAVLATRKPTVIVLHPTRTSGSSEILLTANWQRYIPRVAAGNAPNGRPTASTKTCEEDQASCDPVFEKVEMTLGPVNLGVDKLAQFAGRVSEFLKDLTLPFILVWLAWWLTRKTAERDRKRETQEREQEEQKQIARLLLPKVMRLAGRYYLPMAGNLDRFVRLLPAEPSDAANSRDGATLLQNATHSPDIGELVFYLSSFCLVARTMKEKEGGVFFKDLAAEKIFAIANKVVRGVLVKECGSEEGYMALLDNLERWPPQGAKRWPRFAERPRTDSASWTTLKVWIGKLDNRKLGALRYLFKVLRETLRYESNTPFVYWYSNSSKANLFEFEEKVDSLDVTILGEEWKDDLNKLVCKLAEYCKGKEK